MRHISSSNIDCGTIFGRALDVGDSAGLKTSKTPGAIWAFQKIGAEGSIGQIDFGYYSPMRKTILVRSLERELAHGGVQWHVDLKSKVKEMMLCMGIRIQADITTS